MTYDAGLDLLVCEHSTSSVARLHADGTREVLASHFEGRELNSPNDLCVHSSGAIYFTDPWYGRMPGFGIERPRDLGPIVAKIGLAADEHLGRELAFVHEVVDRHRVFVRCDGHQGHPVLAVAAV